VLDDGRWYRVAGSLVVAVERFVRTLRPSGLDLPAAMRGEAEGDYNQRAAQLAGLKLLDRQLIRLLGQTPIEPCDLLSPAGQFVHVKRRKGGSGPLSHLFSQALVSCECLISEPEFRSALRSLLAAGGPVSPTLLTEPAEPKLLPVVLGLITSAAQPGYAARDLPFFSKVALRQAVRRMQQMSFTVFVDEIPTERP
jgi:uncharacterized protein (TIGR04141 family)